MPEERKDDKPIGERPTEHDDQWGNKAPVDPVTQRYVKKGEGTGGIDEARKEFEPEGLKKIETVKLNSGIVFKKQNFLNAFGKNDKEALYQAHKDERYADYDYLNDQGIFTLRNFKNHREKGVKGLNLSYSQKEIMDNPELVRHIEDIIRESSIVSRVPFDKIVNVLENGLLNQFATKSTRGAFAPSWRARTSRALFGTEIGTASEFDRHMEYGSTFEKYGSLQAPDLLDRVFGETRDGAGWYGRCFVELKNSVKRRTTYTIGDSLDSDAFPQLINGRFDFGTDTTGYSRSSVDEYKIAKAKNITELMRAFGEGSYIELQFHGEIKPSDFESLTIPSDLWSKPRGIEIAKLCVKHGIKMYSAKDYNDGTRRTSLAEVSLVKDENGLEKLEYNKIKEGRTSSRWEDYEREHDKYRT